MLRNERHTHMRADGFVQYAGETVDLVHLQRLPLNLSYVDQVHAVRQLLARPPLADGCLLALDYTGVGRAVSDLFAVLGSEPLRITISAGLEATPLGLNHWSVPKGVLVSLLDASLHAGTLRFADALQESDALREELKDFTRHVTQAGRYSYSARSTRARRSRARCRHRPVGAGRPTGAAGRRVRRLHQQHSVAASTREGMTALYTYTISNLGKEHQQ